MRSLYKKEGKAFTSIALESGLLVDNKSTIDAVQADALVLEAIDVC
jgi:hypothetical protein